MTSSEHPAVQFFHGGPAGLGPGERLLPPSKTGAPTLGLGPEIEVIVPRAERDRVFVSPNPWIALLYACRRGGVVYEVRPGKGLIRDETQGRRTQALIPSVAVWPGLAWSCPEATVVGIYMDGPSGAQLEAFDSIVAILRRVASLQSGGFAPSIAMMSTLVSLASQPGRIPALLEQVGDLGGPLLALIEIFQRAEDRAVEEGFRPFPECHTGRCENPVYADPRGIRRCVLCGLPPAEKKAEPILSVPATKLAKIAELAEAMAPRASRNSELHGPRHWRDVARIAIEVSLHPGADRETVLCFAALHDFQRLSDGLDPEHGARAARRAESMRSAGYLDLSAWQWERLRWALEHHSTAECDDEPTIAACYDADRLALQRLGMRLDPARFSPQIRERLGEAARAAVEIINGPDLRWREVAEAAVGESIYETRDLVHESVPAPST